MPFRVSGKNIEVGEALRERISARVLEALEKYFDGGFSGHVTVGKEAFGFNTECVVILIQGYRCAPIRWPRTPISAPTRRPKSLRSGCAVITADSRITPMAATTARRPGRRRRPCRTM